jgi:hypothetical protein
LILGLWLMLVPLLIGWYSDNAPRAKP